MIQRAVQNSNWVRPNGDTVSRSKHNELNKRTIECDEKAIKRAGIRQISFELACSRPRDIGSGCDGTIGMLFSLPL